jgi:fucose 4-O-acetylase-like acetyltransferase
MIYSGIDSFYIKLGDITGAGNIFLSMVHFLQQSFILAVFFFISGYLTPESYDRHGFSGFVANKAKRLLLPFAFHQIFINLVIILVAGKPISDLLQYLKGYGVAWYCLTVFIFSAVYALLRRAGLRAPELSDKLTNPTWPKVILFGMLMAGANFVLRIFFPLGVYTLGFRFAYFGPYVGFFALGIIAQRYSMAERFSFRQGIVWLVVGLWLGTAGWLGVMGYINNSLSIDRFYGGFTMESFLLSGLDAWTGVGMVMGLLALFSEKANKQGSAAKALCDASFAAYIAHPPIVVACCLACEILPFGGLARVAAACLLSVAASFAAAMALKKAPVLKSIL